MATWYSDWIVQYRRHGAPNWSEHQRPYAALAAARKAAQGDMAMGLYEARVGRHTDQGWSPEPKDGQHVSAEAR